MIMSPSRRVSSRCNGTRKSLQPIHLFSLSLLQGFTGSRFTRWRDPATDLAPPSGLGEGFGSSGKYPCAVDGNPSLGKFGVDHSPSVTGFAH